MTYYCMDREELRQFLDFKAANKAVDMDSLEIRIDSAHDWQVELGCVNYFLSQILEKKAKGGKDCHNIINLVYGLEDKLFFRIHECDHGFVDYMLKHVRQANSSLEDELVVLHNNMCEHIYG